MPAQRPQAPVPDLRGALAFARYAYPPNELGYCGPDDHSALLGYGASGEADGGLVELARGFEGAWPYLEVIAGANSIRDPLDPRVVEAYWLGNSLLEAVPTFAAGSSLEERFRRRAGRAWPRIESCVGSGAHLSHAFHVFAVYPWVGLLRAGNIEHPLRVLDRCRIRWGTVTALDGDRVRVRCSPLVWDGSGISLGSEIEEEVLRGRDGDRLVGDLEPGDRVALHWGWVCDRLTPRQLANLKKYSAAAMDLARAGAASSVASDPGVAALVETSWRPRHE